MEWRLNDGLMNQQQEIAAANYPQIRMITIQKGIALLPVDDCKVVGDTWQICSPETVGGFSAVAYFFGRDLHQNLNVPIGLINSSWGGTLAEAWTEGDCLSQMPYFSDYVKKFVNTSDKEELKRIYQQSSEIGSII